MAMQQVSFQLQPPTDGSFGEEHLKFKCANCNDGVILEQTDFDSHMTAKHPELKFYQVDSSSSNW